MRLVFLLAIALTSPAFAQSLYIDCDAGYPSPMPPSSAYGAAVGIPGVWNAFVNPGSSSLVDVFGQPTNAIITGLTCDAGAEDFTQTSGDDQALLDDWAYADCYDGQLQMQITGMRGGTYEMYCYPLGNGAGLNIFDITLSSGGTIEGGNTILTNNVGPFPGSFVGWNVPVRVLHFPADGASIYLHGGGFGLAGMQLVQLGDITPFCFGDRGNCPCGNVGQVGSGCPSSFSAAGAMLTGAGAIQVSADSLQLTATSVSNSVVTFFQGTTAQNVGLGTPFGDGLRCAGGSTIRLAAVQATNNTVQYPRAGDPSVSLRGAVPSTGGFRTYQAWYRNAAAFCTAATFNLSNGIAVQWTP